MKGKFTWKPGGRVGISHSAPGARFYLTSWRNIAIGSANHNIVSASVDIITQSLLADVPLK